MFKYKLALIMQLFVFFRWKSSFEIRPRSSHGLRKRSEYLWFPVTLFCGVDVIQDVFVESTNKNLGCQHLCRHLAVSSSVLITGQGVVPTYIYIYNTMSFVFCIRPKTEFSTTKPGRSLSSRTTSAAAGSISSKSSRGQGHPKVTVSNGQSIPSVTSTP